MFPSMYSSYGLLTAGSTKVNNPRRYTIPLNEVFGLSTSLL